MYAATRETIIDAGISVPDDVDALRSIEYALLSTLLARAPSQETLDAVSALGGDDTPLGRAHGALAAAAAGIDAEAVRREHFDLFVGVGRGEILPYASYYLTGFLNERPLAAVRRDLGVLGVERAEGLHDPEDHIAILCDVMSELAAGRLGTTSLGEAAFFARHLQPWAPMLFEDLARAPSARFYRAVAAVGSAFVAIEAEAFALKDDMP